VGGATIHALRDVDLTLEAGEIVGLLGVNGAGKTTMLKVVSTLLLPSAGTARVCGRDVVEEARQVKRLVSVVFGGERGLYTRLSARDNIVFFGVLGGMSRREAVRRGRVALEDVGLGDAAGRPVETFSKGMKQRLHLAIGLLTTPRLLMLDEPTVGLDPVEARRVRAAVAELRASGVTVLLTSHYLGDIERLASRVVVLQAGRITHDMPLARLLEQAGAAAEITVSGTGDAPERERLERAAACNGVKVLGLETPAQRLAGGESWRLTLEVERWTPESLRSLATLWPRSEVLDVHVEPASLDQVFTRLASEAPEW
jgi:ABC-2 type transport system ATP-binding protein